MVTRIMPVKQKILVPCDYSELSLDALHFACALALRLNGEVYVLTVTDEKDDGDGTPPISVYREKFSQAAGSGLTGGAVMHPVFRTGRLAKEVLETIVGLGISQLVVGTKGSRGWEGVFAGSNAEKLVRLSPVPVFSVKRRLLPQQIRNIVFPFNHEQNTGSFIREIKQVQELFGARLHLLHIDTGRPEDEGSSLPALREFADRHGLKNFTVNIREDDDERQGITRFAGEIMADMIAMSTHGRNLSSLYLTSIAADVVNHSRLPCWTYALQPG